MTDFEYASPRSEQEAVELLSEHAGDTAVLAAGTDLVPLLRADVLRPRRVVDISRVESLRGIETTGTTVRIGALTTLAELYENAALADFPCLRDVVDGVHAIQITDHGTLGGDLCHLPNCWYFRKGYGLLAREEGKSLAAEGDNRYHAVFGNQGPAKFVSASRFAPALIACEARVRVIGPKAGQETWIPLEEFYVTPRTERQGVTVLKPGQLLTHIELPADEGALTATYEVLEMQGLDWPLAAAACAVVCDDAGLVRHARIVLGHVAPRPWISLLAASALHGRALTPDAVEQAADAAVSEATPLWNNEYKVQLARTSVKRALSRAAGWL